MSRTVTLSPAQDPVEHEISVLADDRFGNTGYSETGRNRRSYEYFGYNEGFTPSRVNVAAAGGADLARFPVNWCTVERSQGVRATGPPPMRSWTGSTPAAAVPPQRQ